MTAKTFSLIIFFCQIILLGCQTDSLDTTDNSQISGQTETVVEKTEQTNNPQQQQNELDSNHQLWKQHALTDYSFTVRQSCFCLLPVSEANVTVVDGEITQISDKKTGEILSDNYWVTNIDQWFEFTQSILTDGNLNEANYHPEFGFPQTIRYGYYEGVEDAGITISITDFEVSSKQKPQQQLDENLAKWQHQALSDYNYTIQTKCFCILKWSEVVVTVRSNVIVDAYDKSTGIQLDDDDKLQLHTLDKLFELTQKAIDSEILDEVIYNADYGFPELLRYGYNQQATDAGISYRVSDFE
ncbi:DUF6174 domain-containing protein [Catenovulum sp. SX2]|uniref:DUF6174 domain-containing protein n=1 Tax=Catenovulum sp. SX2 TaxID=3398614 RepID=UPI003F839E4F